MTHRISPLRGGLSPQMGTTAPPVSPKLHRISKAGKLKQGPPVVASPNNRVPSSISMKRNFGKG